MKNKKTFHEDERLTRLIQENTENSFKPFFSSRVMNQLNARPEVEESFTQALAWIFRRVAVAAMILIVALAVYNISSQHAQGNGRSTLEAALSLPSVTIESSIASFNPTETL